MAETTEERLQRARTALLAEIAREVSDPRVLEAYTPAGVKAIQANLQVASPNIYLTGNQEFVDVLDNLGQRLLCIQAVNIGVITIPEADICELVDRLNALALPWRDRRKVFVDSLAARFWVDLSQTK